MVWAVYKVNRTQHTYFLQCAGGSLDHLARRLLCRLQKSRKHKIKTELKEDNQTVNRGNLDLFADREYMFISIILKFK